MTCGEAVAEEVLCGAFYCHCAGKLLAAVLPACDVCGDGDTLVKLAIRRAR